MIKHNSCIAFCLVVLTIHASAQRFGGHKPSVQWQQVNTPVARVIFPAGLDTTAMRIASLAQQLSNTTLPTIGSRRQKISVVLQPYTTVSNGYVGLGPYRSEFYLTPPANSFELGSLPWHDMLATHEYRHVQQYNNFNVGLSKVLRVLFGQQGQELANALVIPNWFWEGDAVFQETLVSEQGRGRLPFFFDDYRSLWKTGKNYSWMKLRNGSLRDFTPDHYRLGYMMVAYGRIKYGDTFWKEVTHDAATFKGLFYPLQKAIQQHAGKSFEQFRNEAIDYFKQQTGVAPQPATAPKHFVGNQQFPVYADDETILYVKDSYKQIPVFIEKKGDIERVIRVRDVSLDYQFSYRNGRIVYASYKPDVRWSWNDYSEIQVLDVAMGTQTTITHHSKYFSPDISEDNRTIVTVDVQPGGSSQLHILDATTGAVLNRIPNPAHYFYTYPKFVNDKQVVTAARNATGQMALLLVDIASGDVVNLTPFSMRVIGSLNVEKDAVYFSAADDGTDKIFKADIQSKTISSLVAATEGIGAYQPAVRSGKGIVFNTFTSYGSRLQQADAGSKWLAVAPGAWAATGTTSFGVDFKKINGAGLLSSVKTQPAPVSKYPKAFHLFNFHSIRPYVDDPEYTLSLVGENVLNTLQSELFFTYNRNEQYKQFGINETFGGLYPYITAGGHYTVDRRGFYRSNRIYWNEWEAYAGLQLPFNLSKGRSYTSLTIGSNYTYNNPEFKGFYKDSIGNRSFSYLNNYISFSNQSQQARQHIYPRWAQTISFNYKTALTRYSGNQVGVNSNFYFPGFAATHNIVISLAASAKDSSNQVRFSNGFPFSRGYTTENLYRLFKWGVNYHLPLVYPDWGFGNIVYFQRVRANAFFDYTHGMDPAYRVNGQKLDVDFKSTGVELFFDTKWWNNLPVSFGFRFSHLLDPDWMGLFARAPRGENWFEFVLPVSLLQR